MVQLRSMLNPADNSGAKRLMVVGISHKIGRTATVGQVVRCVVRGADSTGVVTDHEKVQVVIVRTRKEIRRTDGTFVKFDDNAGVVIDKQGMPRGTRVLGPVSREVKEAGYTKISSLAKEVL